MPRSVFPSSKILSVVISVAIFSIIVISFFPIFRAEFVAWDDDSHLYANPTIHTLDSQNLIKIFKQTINSTYIPLTTFSFALEYHFFGFNPFVYHLDNFLLHVAVTWLVFCLAQKMGLTISAARLAALIFAIHPMRVESVAWVTERKDVLYGFFYMLAILSYLKYINIKNNEKKVSYGYFLIALLLSFLSMLAKPMALSLPLILLLMDWYFKRPRSWQVIVEKIPFVLVVGALTWLTYSQMMHNWGNKGMESLLIWSWTFSFYVRQFFVPVVSVPVYQLPEPISFGNPEYFFPAFFVLILVIALIRFRKNRLFVFSFWFYFLSIFFILRTHKDLDTNIVADRFMYLAGIGLSFLVAHGLANALEWTVKAQRKIGRWIVCGFVSALIVFLSVRTFEEAHVWQNSEELWRHELKYYPKEPNALNNLGCLLFDKPEFKKAIRDYKKVCSLKAQGQDIAYSADLIDSIKKVNYLINLFKSASSNFPYASFNLGKLYHELELWPEAIRSYEDTLKLDPSFKEVYFYLGELYLNRHNLSEAVTAFGKLLAIAPGEDESYLRIFSAYNQAFQKFPQDLKLKAERDKVLENYLKLTSSRSSNTEIFNNLGIIFTKLGDKQRALLAYQKAVEMSPSDVNALLGVGDLYLNAGVLQEASRLFSRISALEPKNATAHLSLVIISQREGRIQEAMEYYKQAAQDDMKNGAPYFNLGYLYETIEQLKEARKYYQLAIERDPANPEIYYNIGNIYIKEELFQEAQKAYLKVTELNPNHLNAWVNLSIVTLQLGDSLGAEQYLKEARLLGYDPPKEFLKALGQE